MDDPSREPVHLQRLAANEAVCRAHNARISQGAGRLLGHHEQKLFPVSFGCECSDLACREQITLTVDDYDRIHRNRQAFIVRPGHERQEVECLAGSCAEFHIVRKRLPMPVSPTEA
jgi:hypothetical protein